VKKILLIDGFSILNRAFYALPPLTTAAGVHTGAVFGFMSIFLRFLDEEKPDYITIAFDLPQPTFRHERYGAYKGTRRSMPDELREQVPLLKALLEKMNLPPAECAGFEADDVIGTLTAKAAAAGLHPVIVSGDRDLLQLATDTVCIRLPKTKGGKTEVETYFAADVMEKYGVTPAAYIDVKALMGDASDNIPGVPGIGEVTATKIITAYGTLENAIEHAAEIKPKKASENLTEFAEQARISQMLATIVTDAPVELNLISTRDIWSEEALTEITRLELKQLKKRFVIEMGAAGDGAGMVSEASVKTGEPVQVVTNAEEAAKFFDDLIKSGVEAAYFPVWNGDNIIGTAIAPPGQAACYFHVNESLPEADLITAIQPWLTANTPKVTHDVKAEMRRLSTFGIVPTFTFDTFLAAYTLDTLNTEKSLSDLANTYLEEALPTEEDLLSNKGKRGKDRKTPADLPLQTLAEYAGQNASACLAITTHLRNTLCENNQQPLFDDMELPLAFTLFEMETRGIRVEPEILFSYGDLLATRINTLSEAIHKHAGEDFNINSPIQLGTILFEKLGLRGGKKTKQGYSTAAEVLEKLKPAHPIVGLVLEYRANAKLKSTYIDGLLPLMNPHTKRVHSTFHQALTATGRLSSAEPNLQNIPVRLPLGRELRKAFIPQEGCVYVDADYSQIELRVLAHMSGDPVLTRAFQENADIHRITASQVLGIAPEAVTPTQRNNAKAVNFGIVYGISAFGLSEDLGIPVWEAEDYIAGYFLQYPRVKRFMDECVHRAKEKGYAATLFNRRRSVPELKSHNHNIRSFGARVAMNMPIQGTAADIIKIAMLRVSNRLNKENLATRLILQVHDELLLEVPKNELETVIPLIKQEMENAAALDVPLLTDIHSGESWYETK